MMKKNKTLNKNKIKSKKEKNMKKRNNKKSLSSTKPKERDKKNNKTYFDFNSDKLLSKFDKRNINLKTINDIYNNEYQKITKFTDNEINSLNYSKALKIDKRNYCQYYASLLKLNHLLIFSFYCKMKDYNSQIIKIFLFFFFFSLHLTTNALFFSDETMHNIYMGKGQFGFMYQISQIIYSFLISSVISTIIKYLSLSEDIILSMKNNIKVKNSHLNLQKTMKILKIKFFFFFIISFILLLLFGFYISCFCGVYVNTQIHLIKDSIISFGLSFIDPFIVYLIPGIFRICALKSKNMECLYKFSLIVENIESFFF